MITVNFWGSAPNPEVFRGMGALVARWPGTAANTPSAPDLAIRRIVASLGRLLLSRACLRLPSTAQHSLPVVIRHLIIALVDKKWTTTKFCSQQPLTSTAQPRIVAAISKTTPHPQNHPCA